MDNNTLTDEYIKRNHIFMYWIKKYKKDIESCGYDRCSLVDQYNIAMDFRSCDEEDN